MISSINESINEFTPFLLSEVWGQDGVAAVFRKSNDGEFHTLLDLDDGCTFDENDGITIEQVIVLSNLIASAPDMFRMLFRIATRINNLPEKYKDLLDIQQNIITLMNNVQSTYSYSENDNALSM